MTASTDYRITTTARAQNNDGTIDRDTMTHVLTADEIAAGKYLLEPEDRAAGRIARNRHLDQLNASGKFDGLLIDVESS